VVGQIKRLVELQLAVLNRGRPLGYHSNSLQSSQRSWAGRTIIIIPRSAQAAEPRRGHGNLPRQSDRAKWSSFNGLPALPKVAHDSRDKSPCIRALEAQRDSAAARIVPDSIATEQGVHDESDDVGEAITVSRGPRSSRLRVP
jgi:hypothetical protein